MACSDDKILHTREQHKLKVNAKNVTQMDEKERMDERPQFFRLYV